MAAAAAARKKGASLEVSGNWEREGITEVREGNGKRGEQSQWNIRFPYSVVDGSSSGGSYLKGTPLRPVVNRPFDFFADTAICQFVVVTVFSVLDSIRLLPFVRRARPYAPSSRRRPFRPFVRSHARFGRDGDTTLDRLIAGRMDGRTSDR